jgi:hypothetical protein
VSEEASCLFYGELNNIALEIPDGGDAFTLTKELCNIGYFEFSVANTSANRSTIDANYTHIFYIKRMSDDAEVFRGCIGKKRYLDRFTMQLSGYEWYKTLSNETFKYMSSSDLMDPTGVWTWTSPPPLGESYLAEATNPTINDVPLPFDAINGALRIGHTSPFSSIKVKYSTPGVCSAHDLKYSYMKHMGDHGMTTDLPVLDLSQGFTQPAGTYYIIFDAPLKWMSVSYGGVTMYYIVLRIDHLDSTPYTTNPILDQIWLGKPTKSEASDRPITPFRIEYVEIPANEILADVLVGTGFSINSCPSTPISVRGEYQTPLQWIAAIANTLSWTDGNGFENSYEWSISSFNTVTIAQTVSIPETPSEDGQWFSLLDTETNYDEVVTRVIGLGAFNGAQQVSSYAEDYNASEIRELITSDLRFANQQTFDAHTQKVLTGLRVPPQQISVDVLTSSPSAQHFGWIDDYAVGQKVQIKQPGWGIPDTKYRIMHASIGPIFTKLDLSIRQKHLESLRYKPMMGAMSNAIFEI